MSDGQQNEIQRLRDEIDALKKQLDQSQRMTALGELVSTTTHEFNNVLMTIINYAKMGMRHDDKQTRDKAFDKINNAGMRAAKITNAVLGMARNRSEHFELTDVSKLIDESMVLLEREMQKYRISVDIDIDKDIPEISAIGNQIQQVLMNLLINARQAMSEGGQLVIKLKKNLKNNTVDLSVRDYGPGFHRKSCERYLIRFTQQSPVRMKRVKVEPALVYPLVKISLKRTVERFVLKAALGKEPASH